MPDPIIDRRDAVEPTAEELAVALAAGRLRSFLRDTREVIADPETWTPTGVAHSGSGRTGIDPWRSDAVKWSDWGARVVVQRRGDCPMPTWVEASELLRGISEKRHARGIYAVGVTLGHDAVLGVYDEAIASVEAVPA